MARVPVITCVQNDNNIKIIFNIKKDGIYESLLGATIYFQMTELKSGTVYKRIAEITDATTAECMYILTSQDLAIVGTFQTEIQVKYSNGTILTKRNPVVISVVPEVVVGLQ